MRYLLKQLRDYNKEVACMIDIIAINKDDVKARLEKIELYAHNLNIDCKDYAFGTYTSLLDNIATLKAMLEDEEND